MKKKTYIDERGYRRYSGSEKLVHRHQAEKMLGRKLRKSEVVHHKDRNKLNNNPNNLWVFPNQAAHDRVHKIDARRHGKKISYKGFDQKEESGCLITICLLIGILGVTFLLI
ncbi:HNH endonuclease [Constantimarinum furrinae]|uniref:HNH nuclease domain-containing protein n=1 Tax=Constantimarinum furrinae TaxID=2562285 RepID=A0A7G8PRP9_9FLAO|nr:HNH endonuclease [Constantimarinum furrinae]QNJ97015.1 hypothetical protein ALE3EI_0432 [Constantimarinum furrinae]